MNPNPKTQAPSQGARELAEKIVAPIIIFGTPETIERRTTSRETRISEVAALIDSNLSEMVQAHDKAVKTLELLLNLMDKGVLIRDTSHDHELGWALRQIPLVQAIGDAKEAVEAAAALAKWRAG